MNKKTSLLLCAIGAISLSWGSLNFEYDGIDSTTFAVAIAISMALGIYLIVCGMYGLFNNKIKKGEKPMAKTKPNKELLKGNTSVDLMKQEKELESLLAEVKKQLIEKGWINKNGSWGVE
jgi:hypothetical protein